MKHSLKILNCLLLLVLATSAHAQIEDYEYKRELKGVNEQWHKVILPNEIFSKTKPNLADLRIFGFTENNDTIETPYLLQLTTEKKSIKEVAFEILNTSHNETGHFFTFGIPTKATINQIKLKFEQENFDWQISLEGSQNQEEWFTVVEDYRILSIKNNLTDFQFTKLTFPNSNYRFFRLHIESKEKPELKSASFKKLEVIDGEFRNYMINEIKTVENKKTKQTEIEVELELPVRVNYFKIGVSDTFNYYRPITIKYLSDSIKTEKAWKYNYSTLTSGTLNSLEENEFKFKSTTLQKLKIFIENHDNQPLKIDSIEVKGPLHQIFARFTAPATYFLTYGNKQATKPFYDISHFTDNIPESLTALQLGKEQIIEKASSTKKGPLFKNKIWLWGIMTLIILLLGWFSIKMIMKK
ncbi:DUF3999 family protein [Psychroflexus aestuariivivens]|uniref:DUF3999 family protein n=1 Tax=Psychroflexus aestuariivivens TaxID=1795040 RepID=UPI000FDA0D37|nr:DUF3999 family protein [Psychroflexus aestuariivivens]